MDLLNMTKRAQILDRGNFYLSSHRFHLKFGDLLGGWKLATNAKFQHNIS